MAPLNKWLAALLGFHRADFAATRTMINRVACFMAFLGRSLRATLFSKQPRLWPLLTCGRPRSRHLAPFSFLLEVLAGNRDRDDEKCRDSQQIDPTLLLARHQRQACQCLTRGQEPECNREGDEERVAAEAPETQEAQPDDTKAHGDQPGDKPTDAEAHRIPHMIPPIRMRPARRAVSDRARLKSICGSMTRSMKTRRLLRVRKLNDSALDNSRLCRCRRKAAISSQEHRPL